MADFWETYGHRELTVRVVSCIMIPFSLDLHCGVAKQGFSNQLNTSLLGNHKMQRNERDGNILWITMESAILGRSMEMISRYFPCVQEVLEDGRMPCVF